jgi:hypothetical protein
MVQTMANNIFVTANEMSVILTPLTILLFVAGLPTILLSRLTGPLANRWPQDVLAYTTIRLRRPRGLSVNSAYHLAGAPSCGRSNLSIIITTNSNFQKTSCSNGSLKLISNPIHIGHLCSVALPTRISPNYGYGRDGQPRRGYSM